MTNLENMALAALVARMERAPDFGYDDEEVELNRRLALEGKTWRWGVGDRVEIINLPREETA